jgi:hypothetical protein
MLLIDLQQERSVVKDDGSVWRLPVVRSVQRIDP